MRAGRIQRVAVGWSLVLAVWCAAARPASGADRIRVTGTAVAAPAREVLREIDDPHTGDRWLLVRDGTKPGGPGRMLRIEDASAAGTNMTSLPQPAANRVPVVRNGDRVVVEEDTAVMHAWFEAVALGSAIEGGRFNARLTAGGKIVHLVAVGAGRAAFASDGEMQP